MAVIRSGEETIVRHSHVTIGVYYVIVAAAGLIAVFALFGAIGEAVGAGPWTDKAFGVVGWFATSLSLGAMSAQLYAMGRSLARSFVAMGPEGVRVRMPKSGGDIWSPGVERQFPWEQVSGIACEGTRLKPVCKFNAGDYVYALTNSNCPSPKTVAKLLAEKKGVALSAPKGAA